MPKLTEEAARVMNREPTHKELSEALSSMENTLVPGIEGPFVEFFKAVIVKDVLMSQKIVGKEGRTDSTARKGRTDSGADSGTCSHSCALTCTNALKRIILQTDEGDGSGHTP